MPIQKFPSFLRIFGGLPELDAAGNPQLSAVRFLHFQCGAEGCIRIEGIIDSFHRTVYVVEDPVAAVKALSRRGRVYAAALRPDAARLGEITFGENDAVVVGNEGHGLSEAVMAACTDCVYIPMETGVESLNAGVAASVLLWELYRGGRA
jgi:tRNA(Leu) C34 or U34 (ribose-2'-O)-methylase TrmL